MSIMLLSLDRHKWTPSKRHGLGGGFHDPIPKVVNTMSFPRKHIKLEKSKVFDTEIIYARAMTLQATSCGREGYSIHACMLCRSMIKARLKV